MKRSKNLMAALVIAIGFLTAAESAFAIDFTKADKALLQRGRTVRKQLADSMTDGATELSRDKQRSVVQMELGYRIMSVKYQLNVIRKPEQRTMSFGLAAGDRNDIDSARGFWRVFPQKDGRTLLGYVVSVQLPAGLTNLLGKRLQQELEDSLIGLPRYIKKWVESPSGTRYHKMTAKR